jgi:mono/diheme cytochrome c family protein
MARKSKVWIAVLGTMLALGLFSAVLVRPEPGMAGKSPFAVLAKTSGLQSQFVSWAANHEVAGGDRNVELALGWSKGLSRERSEARGFARLNLIDSAAQVAIANLEPGDWDVWLVESRPEGSALPEASDRMHRLGRLTGGQATSRLAVQLEPGFFQRFQADMMVVTRAGKRPESAGVLFGSPDLFQRLYTKGRTAQPVLRAGRTPILASLFAPAVADATAFDSLDPLVAEGADLFFNERFNGNGRTCGTCHPAENNFTIDPKFIATLPPNDPLFVAEFDPNLAVNFEKPQLLRAVGTVLENVDGFEDLAHKFVLRGVPHTLAMLNSRTRQTGSPAIPAERLGWAGDGSPGAGTIREFALGAVTQHFTRTLNRVAGVDFRVPTNEELDALAAFQLALGRQADPDLAAMIFRSPVVSRGKQIYLNDDPTTGAAGRCQRCHMNGGANIVGNENANFPLGVENLPDLPVDLIAPGVRPRDAGFGKGPNPNGGFGNDRFNTPPVIEAADTGPFFHNNAVSTIEEAVGFYNSDAFKNAFGNSLPGGTIHLEATQVEAVAALLRVLNALENIRSSSEFDQAAQDSHDHHQSRNLLALASFDTRDAIRVLEERGLHLDAVALLKQALRMEKGDDDHGDDDHGHDKSFKKDDDHGDDHGKIARILALKAQARAAMIVE